MRIRPQQKLHSISLNKRYWPELFSIRFLNLTDSEGNALAIFESDYTKFQKYLSNSKILDFEHLSAKDKLAHLARANIRIIRYFSAANLQHHELDIRQSSFTADGNIVSNGGNLLKKAGHQNCVALYQGKIYIHPKVRSVPGCLDAADSAESEQKGIIGVSHSSLCQGSDVPFAGSFIHDEKYGWIIENTTGHYSTRAYQLILFLEVLAKQGVDLSLLTVKTWIPHEPKRRPPSLHEADYDTHYENAAAFLARAQKSKKSLDKIMFTNSRVKSCVAALQSPALDSSDYILLVTSILAERLGNQCEHIRAIKHLYLTHQYHSAKLLITSLCRQHVKKTNSLLFAEIMNKSSCLHDNPLKNESRRYFEAKAARLLAENMSTQIFSSVGRFGVFILQFIPSGLKITVPQLVGSISSVNEVFSCMRIIADENRELLRQHDAFRATSELYGSKDRGGKIAGQSSLPSLCPGIMRSVSQLPQDDRRAAETDRIPDLFTLSAKPRGFSSSTPDVPFVNSISGSGYTLIFMLGKYMEQNHGDPALESDVNQILSGWFACSWYHGYHSFNEMMAIFSDPVVSALFKSHDVRINIKTIADSVQDKAFDCAAGYAETLGQKHCMLTAVRTHDKTV
ncbi:hypothetical protein AQUSIP_08150 [Aquicella siphonis]|uniref:Uncharacterized protein n=1 Tax=Aquicella siphonis TaxID=254247 RepID=A0A5E4PFW3_9COXI|nr:hypothetical protein [Aquicella siphonis]VVC75525.1 hypothetical protein AQUSIP_08150 [Aquicella siphonis]